MLRKLTFILALAVLSTDFAHAQIIASSNLDEVCRIASPTSRRTIVYVDLASVRPAETEWGLTILNKLELGAREPLSVLAVNPDNYEVSEVFEGCYPTLTRAEMVDIRSKRGVFDRLIMLDPENQQKENIQTFETRLRGALSNIVDLSSKSKFGARRNVLGAISVDKNRFRDAHSFYRMIIFTDGAIVDVGLSEDKLPQSLAEKYPTSFAGAEVYVYGVKGDKDRPIEAKEKAFSGFFLANAAWVRSFAPSLPQQSADELQRSIVLKGAFEGGGGRGVTTVSFNPTKSGVVEQGWISFLVGTTSFYVPIKGEYSCSESNCRLSAAVLENVPYWAPVPFFRKNDKVVLAGRDKGEFQGSVSAASKEVFKGGAEAQYALQVKFEQ